MPLSNTRESAQEILTAEQKLERRFRDASIEFAQANEKIREASKPWRELRKLHEGENVCLRETNDPKGHCELCVAFRGQDTHKADLSRRTSAKRKMLTAYRAMAQAVAL